MPIVTDPEAVVASHLFHPIVWNNTPIVLTEEIGIGSIVRLFIGDDGLLRAVQITRAVAGKCTKLAGNDRLAPVGPPGLPPAGRR